MSFCFPSWSTAFSPAFHEDAKAMLEGALNKGSKPPVIQGKIEVVELSMGKIVRRRISTFPCNRHLPVANARNPSSQPPTLTLLEIGDLSLDRFRGIFKLGYQGDAWLEVRCRVQANPLCHNPHLHANSALPMSTPLLASQPLLVPMTLKLSLLNLRAILILVISKSKGITLVFKNDPLQNVDVSSTFDSIEVIRGYLQQEIEGQLREMFREDLPGIIHRLSQKWFAGSGMGGRVEMPYRHESVSIRPDDPGTPVPQRDDDEDGGSWHDPYREREMFPPYNPPESSSGAGTAASTSSAMSPNARRKSRSTTSGAAPSSSYPVPSSSTGATPSRRPRLADSPTSYTTFPDIEDYDPTYGMRPEGVPTHSGYEAFGRLWERAKEEKGKGLGGLMGIGATGEGDWADDGDFEEDWVAEGDAEADEMDDLLEQRTHPARDRNGLVDSNGVELDEDGDTASVDAVDASPSLSYLGRRGNGAYGSQRGALTTPSAPPSAVSSLWEPSLQSHSVNGSTSMLARPRIFHAQSQIRAPSESGTVGRPSHMSGLGSLVNPGAMSSPAGTAGTANAGSITARASSVRSSAGGSTMGLGVARSLLDHRTGSATGVGKFWVPSGAQGGRYHSARPDGSGNGEGSGGRPDIARRHSRTESLPSHALHRQHTTRLPPTRLSNVLAVGEAEKMADEERDGYTALVTSPRSVARPLSMPMAPREMTNNALTVSPSRRSRRASSAYRPFFLNNSPPTGLGATRTSNGIVLPLNDSVSQLATLSHSNHTLSPYARNHEHIAVRSFPHLLSRANSMYASNAVVHAHPHHQHHMSYHAGPVFPAGGTQGGWTGEAKIKAKRKRIYRIGAGTSKQQQDPKGAYIEAGTPKTDVALPHHAPSHPVSGASTPQLYSRDATLYSEKLPVTPPSRSMSFKPGAETVTQKSFNRPTLAKRTSYGFPLS
ncbi:hypothetical protein QFC19_001808 [Naganishia cerealis]|uniref:Uncharacterized protein n=1 Tax=Naganishia cerealis TaxID=610337 RepID=A0ACC2WEQ5_9TREE|nr:hypothetical protein QFC19_001808 [Naganishia cerealis]